MKVSPKVDYPIQVIPEEWEEADDSARAPLYHGIFRVLLNHTVTAMFVPDVSAVAPPWDDHTLAGNPDPITTVEAARLVTVLIASYAVTPNDARAGTDERFETPAVDTPEGHIDASVGVVFYVTAAEFERYAAELERLHKVTIGRFPEVPVSQLREYDVVRFIDERIVASRWLAPYHAMMLGR